MRSRYEACRELTASDEGDRAVGSDPTAEGAPGSCCDALEDAKASSSIINSTDMRLYKLKSDFKRRRHSLEVKTRSAWSACSSSAHENRAVVGINGNAAFCHFV